MKPDKESIMKDQRERMIREHLMARGIKDKRVLDIMSELPREKFIPEKYLIDAYGDHPVPIGHNQTISQPYIVAYMTQLVEPKPGMRVLEIGTGSGYQAAILAEIMKEVFTVEIVEGLAAWGESNLRRSGYDHVKVKRADGYYGWKEQAPFDAVIVTAATEHIPSPLVEQLKDGGRMVIPVGSPFRTQMLMLIRKEGGEIRNESLIPVSFVPFTRDH